MKEIAHRVDEDHARRAPAERLFQPLRSQRQIEAGLKRMTARSPEPFRKAFRVAMITAGTDLCAAGDWILGGVRPLNRCRFGHKCLMEQTVNAL